MVICGGLRDRGGGEELQGYRKDFYLQDYSEGLWGHFRCDLRRANARRRCGLSVADLTVVKFHPTPMTHWPSCHYFSIGGGFLGGDGGVGAVGRLLWPVTPQVGPVPTCVSLLR
jgi:hypothetical protein